MAPEQIAEWWGSIDRQTDVYGVGAALFTLLTGRPPWSESRTADVLCKIITIEPAAPVESFRPGSSPRLSAICTRCLAKNRSERFGDMQALQAALEEAALALRN
jgi:serine/threonine-protein kinase